MIYLLFHIIGNSFAIYLAAYLIKGVSFQGTLLDLAIAGVVLGILNFFLKPILKIISTPLIILTLGLFILIINLFIIWLLQFLLPGTLMIEGFAAYFWTLIIISCINFIINHYKKD